VDNDVVLKIEQVTSGRLTGTARWGTKADRPLTGYLFADGTSLRLIIGTALRPKKSSSDSYSEYYDAYRAAVNQQAFACLAELDGTQLGGTWNGSDERGQLRLKLQGMPRWLGAESADPEPEKGP
jgi:hypothetical protein